MAGVNKVILVGNLGKDPEIKYLEGNIARVHFSLATSEVYKDKAGNRVEQTEWHNIVIWRALAESAEKILKKGPIVSHFAGNFFLFLHDNFRHFRIFSRSR